MNDLVRFSTNVSALYGKKRGRKPVFNSNMFYPHVQERELQGATTREFLRFIAEALLVAENGLVLADDIGELSDLDPRLPDDFREEVSKVGKSIENKALSNFAKQSEMIIGKPYYPPEVKEDILNTWEANFQMLCKSAETDAKKDIAQLVQQAKSEGWNKDKLERAVKGNLTDKYKNRAELIARTESAKLNSQVSLETYKSIGIEYYTWMTTIDGRERQSHAEMNGLICSVDDPDVYFEENPEDPMHPIRKERTGSMVHMHPGTDFQCRCSMVAWDPYINGKYEVKELPEEEPEEKEPTALETANESLAEKEKELEIAENGRKKAESELEKEKKARESAEKTVKNEAEKSISAAENGLESAKRYEGVTNDPGLEKCVTEVKEAEKETKKSGIASTLYEKLDALKERIFGIQSEEDVMETLGAKRFKSKKSLLQVVNGTNPTKSGSNCPACAAVYELRCRGWNVSAKDELKSIYHSDPSLIYKTPQKIKFSSYRDAEKEMAAFEDGSRFTICFTMLKNGKVKDHVISAFIENGRVVLVDPQMDDYKVVDYFRKYKLVGPDHFLFKVDGLKFKPSALKDLLE